MIMDPSVNVTEVGPDLYRLSVYVPDFDLQFTDVLELYSRSR